MTFEILLKDIDCNCLNNANEDTTSTFGIVSQNIPLRDKNFYSKWEKGKFPDDANDCRQVCSKKGVSLSLFNEQTKDTVISIFKQLFTSAPAYKTYINVIKLEPDAGFVKATPSRNNPHHYDFYKSDQFNINKINNIESNSFASYV